MIFVGFDLPDDDAWREWNAKAAEKTDLLKKSFRLGEKHEIDTKFYKEQREHLLKAFNRKCAYCETRIDRMPVDVEHFRPKGGVTDLRREMIKIRDRGGREYFHPGYYWLAYAWENLLPSCIDCNRKRYHEDQDASWGKETCFPVEGENYVWDPSDVLEVEKPLLINPRFTNPDAHLEFKLQPGDLKRPRLGLVAWRDEVGKQTSSVFGLNDENLAAPRLAAYERAYTKMMELRSAIDNFENFPEEIVRTRIEEVRKEIKMIWNGSEAYTAFGRLGIRTYADRHRLYFNID